VLLVVVVLNDCFLYICGVLWAVYRTRFAYDGILLGKAARRPFLGFMVLRTGGFIIPMQVQHIEHRPRFEMLGQRSPLHLRMGKRYVLWLREMASNASIDWARKRFWRTPTCKKAPAQEFVSLSPFWGVTLVVSQAEDQQHAPIYCNRLETGEPPGCPPSSDLICEYALSEAC